MNNNIKEYVKRKKRRKRLKKLILWLFVFIIGIVIFIYKSPLFNVKQITIYGLVTLSEDDIQEKLKYNIGQNIFTIDYSKIKSSLIENPYIKNVKVAKKGINGITINIEENKISYYYENQGIIKTINNEGIITEELKDISDRKLTKLTGLDLSSKKIGEKIIDNSEITTILETFYKMIEVMPENYSFSEINIKDINSISCNIGNVKIIIGNSENLIDKINLALNLIDQGTISKGYIDMSFDGPPVIKKEE